MNNGYIYCLSNRSYGNSVYKIGFTTKEPLERANQLYKTGVPTPFHVEESVYVHNYREKERTIHDLLQSHRINHGREFFKIPIEKVRQIFLLMQGTTMSSKPTRRVHNDKRENNRPKSERKFLRRKAKKDVIYSK